MPSLLEALMQGVEPLKQIAKYNPVVGPGLMLTDALTGRNPLPAPLDRLGDLGKISIRQQPIVNAPVATSPINSQPNPLPSNMDMNSIRQNFVNQQGVNQNNQSQDLHKLLISLGLPLISTIAGLTNKSFLPGAAGFNTGYGTGLEKTREFALKEKNANRMSAAYTFNADTGEYEPTGVMLPKGAHIRNLTTQKQNELNTVLANLIGAPESKSTKQITNEVKNKTGGILKIDANGNKAMVYPDGSYEEIK